MHALSRLLHLSSHIGSGFTALCTTAFIALTFLAMTASAAEYRVRDNSYTVCEAEAQYRKLLSWSLYGVGSKPTSGCFPAPANAKAIIMQCPEGDIMLCQFRLTPADGSPSMEVWASKVMLQETP